MAFLTTTCDIPRVARMVIHMRSVEFLTPDELLAEVGDRLRRWRLDKRTSQAALAAKAGVSLKALQALEGGHGSALGTYVRVLKALGLLETLDALVPVPLISPIDMLNRRYVKHARQRAPKAKAHK
ncbi:helix-turn-helix domain-containing protein [Luteimonas sp. B3_2_R+30]|uniref:Helix-turn-helix domain-containing protein n=2 Tax=Luteimonas salinilitoris TaxID=3237697 RepID=A0ABV4HUI3_9GAMM